MYNSKTRSVDYFFILFFSTEVTITGTNSDLSGRVWVTAYKGDAYGAVNL